MTNDNLSVSQRTLRAQKRLHSHTTDEISNKEERGIREAGIDDAASFGNNDSEESENEGGENGVELEIVSPPTQQNRNQNRRIGLTPLESSVQISKMMRMI